MTQNDGDEPVHQGSPRLARRVKPSKLARLKWIETALRSGEKVDGRRYTEYFSVSRPMLTQDLQSFSDMVNWLGGIAETARGTVVVEKWPSEGCAGCYQPLPWHRMNAPETVEEIEVRQIVEPSPDIQNAISRSIRTRTPMRAEYISITSGRRSALLSPHHVVHAVGRSHVRAYDHDRNEFRDFVLARMSAVQKSTDMTFVSDETDKDWHDFVGVRLEVSVNLEEEQRLAIAMGAGLKAADECVEFTCRRCLIDYELLARGIRPAHYRPFFDVIVQNPSNF